jgi:hypothetical protein
MFTERRWSKIDAVQSEPGGKIPVATLLGDVLI